eukprot:363887-Chlamydomonas_euryale.AAC.8
MGGPEMLLHHMGALVSVLTAVTTGQGHMHTMWMLATEFTTPFIDLRWWLDKANLKSSRLYMYNGMAIFVSWVVARLCIFPPFFYVVWQQREQISLVYPFARALRKCRGVMGALFMSACLAVSECNGRLLRCAPVCFGNSHGP